MRILFSQNFAYAKFCENKVRTKISEFTVVPYIDFYFYQFTTSTLVTHFWFFYEKQDTVRP